MHGAHRNWEMLSTMRSRPSSANVDISRVSHGGYTIVDCLGVVRGASFNDTRGRRGWIAKDNRAAAIAIGK